MILNIYEFKHVHIKLQVTTLCEQDHKCISYKAMDDIYVQFSSQHVICQNTTV